MNLFYTPNIEGEFYELSEEESKHCVRVLRLKESDVIHLIDGKGNFFETEIVSANPKRCAVKVLKKVSEFEKRDFYLHIAIAPTKNIERFETFLEKAVEIGIDEISPIFTEHSERKSIKIDRMEKIIISAMKQSLKAYLPKINEAIKFKDFIEKDFEGQKLIAHCYDFPKLHLKNCCKPKENILILIGPEGDFSEKEVELAKKNNFFEISLSSSRLRTETAGIVACSIVDFVNY